MVLETTLQHRHRHARCVTDALALGADSHEHQLGGGAPHLLIRRVDCTDGAVDVELEYAPRAEYGLVSRCWPTSTAGSPPAAAPTGWCSPRRSRCDARRRYRPRLGCTWRPARRRTSRCTAARWATSGPGVDAARARRAASTDTIAAWRAWSELHQAYEGRGPTWCTAAAGCCRRLHYQPSGAIVAAATTSLPEGVGGERNWDYRYSWVRDASFTMDALWVAACPDEADDFFAFMTHRGAPARSGAVAALQIMFGVGGEHDLTERELPHLAGWRDSRPVRVGNGAWNQQQVDVYGELLDAAHRLADQLGELDDDPRRSWSPWPTPPPPGGARPDQGIWEVRGEPRHFLYSKVMCWVALDRAIALAEPARRRRSGRRLAARPGRDPRDRAARGLERRGRRVHPVLRLRPTLDASNLMMPIVGFLPADDPADAGHDRRRSPSGSPTSAAWSTATAPRRASTGSPARRARSCSARSGWRRRWRWPAQVERAQAVVRARRRATSTTSACWPRRSTPETGELLGNFPQAFSHIGLVNAAWAISQAEQTA